MSATPQTVYPPQGTSILSSGFSGIMQLTVVGYVKNPQMTTVLDTPTPTGPAVTMSTVLTTGVA